MRYFEVGCSATLHYNPIKAFLFFALVHLELLAALVQRSPRSAAGGLLPSLANPDTQERPHMCNLNHEDIPTCGEVTGSKEKASDNPALGSAA